ncbi:MAG: hypothetical protein JNK00_11200 [Flavipsychrobacter sp.]|nr:hypothetical protein [Flavipsychrobacter sp.]
MVIAKWGIIPPLHISIHKNNVMDCLIYFRIDNAAIRRGMYNELKLITPNVRYKHYLIKIEGVDVFGSTNKGLRNSLVKYFHQNELEENDELYIYYWSLTTIGVIRLKKKGHLKIAEVHKRMQGVEASLGAMLGLLE